MKTASITNSLSHLSREQIEGVQRFADALTKKKKTPNKAWLDIDYSQISESYILCFLR